MARIGKFLIESGRADAVGIDNIPNLPVKLQDAVDFFNHAQKTKDGTQASYQTLNSYVSAIKHYYKEAGVVDEELYAFIKTMLEGRDCVLAYFESYSANSQFFHLCKGYKRVVAKEKDEGRMKKEEGKQPLSVAAYTLIAKAMLQKKEDVLLFVMTRLFMVLQASLGDRSVSTGDINVSSMRWNNDMLEIDQHRSKSDQAGERAHTRSVAANPSNPTICPILALAVYVFCNNVHGGANLLFGKSKCEQKFSEALHVIITELKEPLSALGFQSGDIGTHSLKKFMISFLSTMMQVSNAKFIYLFIFIYFFEYIYY